MIWRFKANFLPIIAVCTAAAAIILVATTNWRDVQDWNLVCGARVRTYDAYAMVVTHEGLPGPLPFLVKCFLILAVPAALMRSLPARSISVVLMSIMLLLEMGAAGSVSEQAYYGECYRGGHENGPGDVDWLVFILGMLIAAVHSVVLALDWIIWAALSLFRQFRKTPATSGGR